MSASFDDYLRALKSDDEETCRRLVAATRPSPLQPLEWLSFVSGRTTLARRWLRIAVELRERDVALALVRHGASAYRSLGEDVPSLVTIAACSDDAWCEKLLKEFPPRSSSDLAEALFYAATGGQLGTVKLLLAHGADAKALCASRNISLLRVRGDVLRTLREHGGVLPPDIAALVDERQALGD